MKIIKLLAITTLVLSGCGDNKSSPDARTKDSNTSPDAVTFPAAPTLGAQIDRMARPAVNTVLNHGLDPSMDGKDAKDTYNQMTSRLTEWLSPANVGEFMKNLALIDLLDSGRCGNGICEENETFLTCPVPAQSGDDPGDCTATSVPAGNGCGNQVLYNGSPTGGGSPAADSYSSLAKILADDELYLDTSKPNCLFYLAVEYGVVSSGTQGTNTTCGGRAPDYDVIDFSYSILAMGIRGIDVATFTPLVQDGVGKHPDVTTTFPYLGAPHATP